VEEGYLETLPSGQVSLTERMSRLRFAKLDPSRMPAMAAPLYLAEFSCSRDALVERVRLQR
jgi:hypothetical protein